MKGLVLAGGKGTRISSITKGSNKCLLTINDRSIVSHNVKNLCALDEIDECIVVVGYRADAIIRDLGLKCNNKKITYCVQKKQKGLINALESAIENIQGNDFFMVLGDEMILKNHYQEAIKKFNSSKVSSLIGIILVDDITNVKKTYTFKIDEEGNMTSFVEKPVYPFNNYMGTGNVIFRRDVLDLLAEVPVNPIRGEKELVDLCNLILEKERSIGSFVVGDAYFNINTIEDFEAMEATFLGIK